MPRRDPRQWNFNIDQYLNPWVPSPPWNYVPKPISHFFGHQATPPAKTGNVLAVLVAFIGIFGAISVIEVVSSHIPQSRQNGFPVIVGSLGATAVLEFYSIDSPLAQPRNMIMGHFLSSLIGVCICKLFRLSDEFESLRWVAGALACASATSIMALTNTVHPPAGATALLAVVDNGIVNLGWFYIPVLLLGCALMLACALLVNNLLRRFPVYWWTPEDLSTVRRPWRRRSI